MQETKRQESILKSVKSTLYLKLLNPVLSLQYFAYKYTQNHNVGKSSLKNVVAEFTIVAIPSDRAGVCGLWLLGLWVRIPPGERMSVSCECCVLAGRGLGVGLIIRPGEFNRVRCV